MRTTCTMRGSETNCIQVGFEITPRRRAAIVALHHPQLGVNPLSLRKITEILEVPKSTCAHIYKHALKNAAAKRLVVELAREGRDTECDAFLAGIDAQLNSLYAVPEVQTVLGESSADEEEEFIPLRELISAECLDSDARSGRPQVLSEVEKDHLVATVRWSWGT